MPSVLPFTSGYTRTINAGTDGANRLAATGGGTTLCVTNTGTVPVYVKTGDSTVTVSTADALVPAGATVFFCIPGADTHVAAYTNSVTSATTYIMRGDGGA